MAPKLEAMQYKLDESFEKFVKQQFCNLAEQMSMLTNTLAFTVKRVKYVKQSLNFKVVIPVEAHTYNSNSDEMVDDLVLHIDTFSL
ncbi:1772_t:CDS:1, partial [Funneliformis geosporum]